MNKTYAILGGGGAFGILTARHLLDHVDPEMVVGIGRNPLRPEPFSLGIDRRGRYDYKTFHIGHETSLLLEYLDALKPDVIINFAAQGEGAASWRHSWRFFDTNATALSKLYEELSHRDWFNPRGHFIHIGTSELYGSVDRPAREDDPIRPSSPYAASKAAFDLYLMALAQAGRGVPTTILRPSNCYCPGQLLHRIIPRAVVCGLTGRKLPLHGGGLAEKSYLHAGDLARAIRLVNLHRARCVGGVFNVGPPRPTPIREVVSMVAARLDVDLGDLCEEAGERLGQDQRYWLDSAALHEATGWRQEIGWRAGLYDMIRWGRQYIDQLGRASQTYQLRA